MAVSMHGLDLSFMKTNPLPKKRGRPPKRVTFAHLRSDVVAAPAFMGDIAEFVSPVGATPELISSRPQLREHEKKHNVFQVGNDFGVGKIGAKNDAKKAEWKRKAAGVTTGWGDLA